jgi:hypothetical protein
MSVFAGLVPIVASLFLYFGPPEKERIITASGLFVSLSISLAIIFTAACAWLGYGWARFTLIVLAVIHYGLIAHNLYSLGHSDEFPETKMLFIWTRMARALISMTVVVLYLLLSRNAKDFFRDYRKTA